MTNDDRTLASRLPPVITVVVLLLVGSLVPKGEVTGKDSLRLARSKKARVASEHRFAKATEKAGLRLGLGHEGTVAEAPELDVELASGGPDLSAYEGLGSWIDIYDEWPWDNPVKAVKQLDRRGVRSIFLQTSNWGADRAIFRPEQTTKFLKAAHRRDMQVVSWYVPSFAKKREDYNRSRAAIRFERDGHRFDSFGLDIESTVVSDISRRNERLLDLSKRLRRLVGPDYTLGAITPDPVKALYWPDFPYKEVGRLYDVFAPMGYFSFRTNGYRGVQRYTVASIRNIRRASGNPDVPIHLIGGIGGETRVPEVKAFVRAVKAGEVLGGSYYDMTVTSEQEWQHLETLAEVPEPQPTPSETTPAPTPTEIGASEVKPTPLPHLDDVAAKEADKAAKKAKKAKKAKSNGPKDNKKSDKNEKNDEPNKKSKNRAGKDASSKKEDRDANAQRKQSEDKRRKRGDRNG